MATLFIDRSNSVCGNCQRSALPNQPTHETIPGYSGPRTGCGVRFTAVSSHYYGDNVQAACQEIRPDLPWVAPMYGGAEDTP